MPTHGNVPREVGRQPSDSAMRPRVLPRCQSPIHPVSRPPRPSPARLPWVASPRPMSVLVALLGTGDGCGVVAYTAGNAKADPMSKIDDLDRNVRVEQHRASWIRYPADLDQMKAEVMAYWQSQPAHVRWAAAARMSLDAYGLKGEAPRMDKTLFRRRSTV